MNIKKLIFLVIFLESFYLKAYSFTNEKQTKTSNVISKEKFYPSTTVKGDLIFTLGAVDSETKSEALHFSYENKLKLNTSFNGSDKLFTVIESGNATTSPLNLDLQSKKGETLKISTMIYQFQISNAIDAIIGPQMFGYHGLAGKSTAYNERIAILDGSNFTTSSGLGPGMGISAKNDNGINASLKISSNSTEINENTTHLISQIGLTKKNFGGTITSNINNEFTAYGVAIYYNPQNFPSISMSIEEKNGNNLKNTRNWIIASQKRYADKTFGIAFGTYNEEEKIGYEGWSEISINDKLSIIPVVFVRETNTNPELGIALNTKFRY